MLRSVTPPAPVLFVIRLCLLSALAWGPARPAAGQCLNNFALVGTATYQNNQYQLTRSGSFFDLGAMWSANTIDLRYAFDFTFRVNQCGAADGVVFVLHQGGTAASSGEGGGALGYYAGNRQAFGQSLGVELDTYQNNGAPYNDSNDSHLALVTNANPQPVRGPFAIQPKLGSCRDRLLHLTWDPAARRFAVALDGIPRLAYDLDLVSILFRGNPRVTFGFVGSSGGQTSTQTIQPVSLTAGGPTTAILADGPTTICVPGAVTLRITGQPAGTTYAWTPATGLSDSTSATVVAAPTTTTTYTVTIATPDGCTTQGATTVTVRPALLVTAGPARAICAGGSTILRATSAGAAPVLSYSWSPPTGLSTTSGDSIVATPTFTTRYTVTATNADGCVAQDTVRVVVRPALRVTAGPDRLILPGQPTTLTADAGAPGVTYAWSPATGLDTAVGPEVRASPTTTTRYTVTATDPAGCTGQATVLVAVNPTLQVAAGPDQVLCLGTSVPLTATSNGRNSTYAWSPAAGLNTTTGATVVAAPTVPTAYTVVVTDSAGYTGQAMVRVSPIDVPTVAPEARVVRLRERLVRFAATVGAGPVSALRWDFGDGSALDSSASPTHAYPRPGTYAARLTVRYGPACAVAVAVPVVVPDLVLPNVITPNHDELNDTFRPVVSTGPVGLRVYNRWGALVFEQTAYAGDWGDGVAAGTYYYRLTADNENWQGWLEVVR